MACEDVSFGELVPTFRRTIMSSSSGSGSQGKVSTCIMWVVGDEGGEWRQGVGPQCTLALNLGWRLRGGKKENETAMEK